MTQDSPLILSKCKRQRNLRVVEPTIEEPSILESSSSQAIKEYPIVVSQKVGDNEYRGLVDDTEWRAWMHRKAQFEETNVLQQPELTLQSG